MAEVEAGGTPGFERTTAVILCGGRGSRLGGREKGEIRIGEARLIDIAVGAAIEAGCVAAITVGEVKSVHPAERVRESPPFGGPVAGLAAALPLVSSPALLLLPCDLPRAAELCSSIANAASRLPAERDGTVVAGPDGRLQWLCGWYRSKPLADALRRFASPDGLAAHHLMAELELEPIEDPLDLSRDIDTPEDLEA